MKVFEAYLAPGCSYQEVRAALVKITKRASGDGDAPSPDAAWLLNSNVIRTLGAMKTASGGKQFPSINRSTRRFLLGRSVYRVMGSDPVIRLVVPSR